MQLKRYLEELVCRCCPEIEFGQDAVELAIVQGWVTPSYENMDDDVRLIMEHYDEIVVAYRKWRQHNPEVRLIA